MRLSRAVNAGAVLLAGLLLVGCATKPVALGQATIASTAATFSAFESIRYPKEGLAKVVVIRDAGFRGGGAKVALYVDGTEVAELRTTEKLEFYLAPGPHLLGAQIVSPFHRGQLRETSTQIDGSKANYFRTGIDSSEVFIAPTSQAD